MGSATNSFASLTGLQNPARSKGETSFASNAAGYTLTGQNVLIRARGYYRKGGGSGSQSIEDKVQIAFLFVPTAADVSLSGSVVAGQVYVFDVRSKENSFVPQILNISEEVRDLSFTAQ